MGKIYRDGQLVGVCQPGWEWLSETASRAAAKQKPQELGDHPSACALGVAMRAEYQRQHPELFDQPEASTAPVAGPAEATKKVSAKSLFLSTKDLAELLGYTRETVCEMNRRGDLPLPANLGSTRPRWLKATIQKWLDLGMPKRQQFQKIVDDERKSKKCGRCV